MYVILGLVVIAAFAAMTFAAALKPDPAPADLVVEPARRPRVLIEISDGVTDYTVDPGVDVALVDHDRGEQIPESHSGMKALPPALNIWQHAQELANEQCRTLAVVSVTINRNRRTTVVSSEFVGSDEYLAHDGVLHGHVHPQ